MNMLPTNSDWRWLRLALKVCVEGKHSAHRMGAVVVKSGAVWGKAANISKPWGLLNRGRHAEERALCRGRDWKGTVVFVAREGGKMSKPCVRCREMMRSKGVSEVVYFGWSGEVVREAV